MLTLFFSLFVAAVVWLGLVLALFEQLAMNHPAMFQSLGSPRGFEPKTTDALFRFLFSSRPESLGDPSILLHANIMRALFPAYMLGFCVMLYWVLSSGVSGRGDR